MKITHTLIQKFLSNQCSATEAEMVAAHLEKHPELVDIYLKSSWEAAGEESRGLPPGYADEMRAAVNTIFAKQTNFNRFRWLAAACLLVAAVAAGLFFAVQKNPLQTLAKAEQQTAAPAQWKTQRNTSATAIIIKPGDGSIIKLAPHAVIRYRQPFMQKGERNIWLQGEADFDVAHDKTKPFTVYTNLCSTTALGTSFRVSGTAVTCHVKLFEGKVLVKPMLNTLKGWSNNIILLPGNEMKYDLKKSAVSVVQFNTRIKQSLPGRNYNLSAVQNKSTLVFDNTPLPDVIKTLATRYQFPISCNEDLLKGKYFSGEVRKSDSLAVVLKIIANMNGLQVTKKANTYIVTELK